MCRHESYTASNKTCYPGKWRDHTFVATEKPRAVSEGAGGFSHLHQWHTLRSSLCFAAAVSAADECVITIMIAGVVYREKSNSQIQFLVNEAFNSVQLSTPDPSTDSEDCLTPSDREFAMIMDRSSPSEVSMLDL